MPVIMKITRCYECAFYRPSPTDEFGKCAWWAELGMNVDVKPGDFCSHAVPKKPKNPKPGGLKK